MEGLTLTDWRFVNWEEREQVSAESRDGVGCAQELHTVGDDVSQDGKKL